MFFSRKKKVKMKTKHSVSVVYDRKKRVEKTGEGNVEICIYLKRNVRKFIIWRSCNPLEWRQYKKSDELRKEITLYQQVLDKMVKNDEELSVANFNLHIGISPDSIEKREARKYSTSRGFIDFINNQMTKEKLSPGTASHRKVTLDALERFGKMKSFNELTPPNVKAFDDFLHDECDRTLTTINNYHKTLRKYVQMAFELGYIPRNPYKNPLCRFDRGKSQERRPLSEDELIQLRALDDLSEKEERVRDLFVFCAYTGLSYSDSQIFDFKTMTEKLKDYIYIDGRRVKTGNTYFTPILPPAMEVLEKYGYQLPHISNQKANDFLHLIESRLKFRKPLTMHVARHSFATLALSYDIPIENVARMLGHSNIKTTQIYAHILHSTIARHTETFASKIR